ncbi:MAG TPA: SRPBCC family protein [Solirubrobacteraceae bacterium]|nr:SRPBCC family protein [Solirubrobacteraceae bacterium]
MSAVDCRIEIAAPPEAVWNVVMDPTRLGEWVTIHRRLESHDATHMEQVLCLRGVTFHVRWELEESAPTRYARWRGRGPARCRAEIEYRLTAVDGGTRFDYHNDFRAPLGPLGAAAGRALVGGLPEREATATLRALKDLVERSARPT